MARRKATPLVDTGTHEVIERPIDEVGMEPPSEAPVLQVPKPKNRKNLFNTELILEAAQPQYEAKDFASLIALCSYDEDPAIRTRVSQMVNVGKLDPKFRPPAPVKKKGKA